MTSLLPLASYNLALNPFTPTQAIESELPVTVHLTLAAIDPEGAIDDDEQPSTLRILKSSAFRNLDEDSSDDDLSEDGEDAELNEDSDEDKIEEDSDEEDAGENDAEDDDEEDDEDFNDDEDDEIEEYVVCTLSPKSQYQQTLDLTISPDEEVFFVVTGSYPIHLSGNFVEHPYDEEDSEFDSDEDSEDEYDLSPDEDEIIGEDFDINDLEDESDVEGKIEELVEEEEANKVEAPKETKKSKKENKKRQVEEEEAKPEPKETKKQKKAKEEKNVKFNKELEQGPTESKKESAPKSTTKTLPGGVVIEDRTVGKGPTAKNGSRVGVRYIGKLKNGSVFDKNTSGKPFNFGLGKGEVIKGWDVGVVGMAVGGERRIVIPAKMAYGSQKLPGIPANSELTFDVKLVSIK